MVSVYACEHTMKQIEHKLGKACHHRLVVDGTKHAHISGNGVEGMGSTNEVFLTEFLDFRFDITKPDYVTIKELAERANGITIKVGGRKASATF